ncbi:MAG: hypothetical protein WD801_02415 [Gemmatimonadaceae bacterium]
MFSTDEIVIRDLATQAEYAACVELQRDTWGRNFRETVPPSMLLVAQKVGGVAAGAFDRAGTLLGFVFGITGVRRGEIVHWSDMLAVRASAQGRGIGRRLKEFQRAAVASVGARAILWTYDPLVARSAHLNFNVLGVRATEYVPDMYGSNTGSDLHGGGTDRLVVEWSVAEAELAARQREIVAARTSTDLVNAPVVEAETEALIGTARHLRIPIPNDVASEAHLADDYRARTRLALTAAMDAGYRIDGFMPDPGANRSYYLLQVQAK